MVPVTSATVYPAGACCGVQVASALAQAASVAELPSEHDAAGNAHSLSVQHVGSSSESHVAPAHLSSAWIYDVQPGQHSAEPSVPASRSHTLAGVHVWCVQVVSVVDVPSEHALVSVHVPDAVQVCAVQPTYGVSTAVQSCTVQPSYGVLTAVHAGVVQPAYGVFTAVQSGTLHPQ